MIKKCQPKQINYTNLTNKSNLYNQHQPISRKKSLKQNQNHPSYYYHQSSSYNTLKSNQYSPLKELNNNRNNNKQPQTQQKFQKYLKSQTSLNDLSAIAPLQMSCSSKKDINNQIEFMQNFDKIYKQTLINYRDNIIKQQESKFCLLKNSFKPKQQKLIIPSSIKRQLQYQKPNTIDSYHPPIQDFQILDIYATSLLNVNSTIIQKNQQQKNTRKTGGIRRNSLSQATQKQNHPRKTPIQINQPIIYETHKKSITEQPQKKPIYSQKETSKKNSQQNLKVKTIIDNSIQQLFYSVSSNKITLSQSQIQKFPFSCEIKLLLGPILTKFRQNKYFSINLLQFSKEFLSILEDFSQKQKAQICDKILQGKFRTQQLTLSLRTQQEYFVKKNRENECLRQMFSTKDIDQRNKETQDRLILLNSKVDSYLSRISQQYNSNYEVPKKQKISTLMSRLSQIEEISGDSDDLMSKNDSYRDEKSNICPNKNVYVNETLFLEEQVNTQQGQNIEENNKLNIQEPQNLNLQQGYFQKYTNNRQRQIESRLIIEKSYSNSLTQSRSHNWQSKRSSLNNSRLNVQSDNRRPQIFNPYNSHSNEHHEETLYPSSLRSINLSFSELEKYLQ